MLQDFDITTILEGPAAKDIIVMLLNIVETIK